MANEKEYGDPIMVPALLTPTAMFLLLPDGCIARIVDPQVEVAGPELLLEALLEVLGEEAAEEAQAYVNQMGGRGE